MLIKRWWRSRGFGVHSPFAFRMITRVLCDEGAHYYAFGEIDARCKDRHERRLARRLYRALVAVPVKSIKVEGQELPDGIATAVKLAPRCDDGAEATLRYGKQSLAVIIEDKTTPCNTLTLEGRRDIYTLRLKNTPEAHFPIL